MSEAISIGMRIRQERLDAAMTQEELAEEADLATVTISKIERGEHHPHPTTVRKIAHALDVSPRELTRGRGGSSSRRRV